MMRPIRDNVLVKPKAQEERTKSGLYIPLARLTANNNAELVEAEVVAVGEGTYTQKGELIKPSVKVGDTVLFGGRNYTGTKVEEDGVEYRLIKEIDCLFKVDKEAVE